ncbi:hypothetical protein K457DRAFT_204658 [Linnemannia elongata AG-77]|uniref:Uncharacterized protein n=1 Tax=Linnemannia elongata AG-77 TaxID=1314771 RepID=A0A197JGJ9_9FUNG|nr:hypothetical protein K457DRAFT_204658 [Linnemannia elongata AG-77]
MDGTFDSPWVPASPAYDIGSAVFPFFFLLFFAYLLHLFVLNDEPFLLSSGVFIFPLSLSLSMRSFSLFFLVMYHIFSTNVSIIIPSFLSF